MDGWGDPAAEMRFLVGGASGWLLTTAVATVTGEGGSGRQWKNDGMGLGTTRIFFGKIICLPA